MRNHEVSNTTNTPVGNPALAYDVFARGGTTTLVVDPVTRMLEASWLSLSGTVRNCAGGPTPWGSWITCEETNVGPRANVTPKYGKIHGYNFEVPAASDTEVLAEPLTAMGLFYHEAVAVDPDGSTSTTRLAENIVPGNTGSEWAGACFSPDGQTLFANLQGPGLTFAIWTDHWQTIN